MTLDEKVKQFKIISLRIIAEKLKNGEMSLQKAKEISKDLSLKLINFFSEEQINLAVINICSKFKELNAALIFFTNQKDQESAQQIEKLISLGKIDDAYALIKR